MIKHLILILALAVALLGPSFSSVSSADQLRVQGETAWTAVDGQAAPGGLTRLEQDAPMTALPVLQPDGTLVAQFCCKHCSSGKPCGDSCIARNKTCRSGKGCACATVDIY